MLRSHRSETDYLVGLFTSGILGKCDAMIQVQMKALEWAMLHAQCLQS